MTSDVLGYRVHRYVCSQLGWVLQDWRHERIIDSKQSSLLLAKLSDSSNISALECGIGWALNPDKPGILPDFLFDFAEVAHVHVFELDARVVRVDELQVPLHACVDVVNAEQVVALLQHGQHGHHGCET